MADIRAGDEISAGWWPESVQAESSTDIDDITSGTFAPGASPVAVNFVAPLSGRVAVAVVGGIDQDSATDRAFISYAMYEGEDATGVLVRSARQGNGISSPGGNASDEMICGNMSMMSGLTPGATHYAEIQYATEGATGTNDITYRKIIVFPLP
jgi:hypothetical protein